MRVSCNSGQTDDFLQYTAFCKISEVIREGILKYKNMQIQSVIHYLGEFFFSHLKYVFFSKVNAFSQLVMPLLGQSSLLLMAVIYIIFHHTTKVLVTELTCPCRQQPTKAHGSHITAVTQLISNFWVTSFAWTC